jgi:CRP/FNR family transcriptional regulator, cyclic AMP receptor protein
MSTITTERLPESGKRRRRSRAIEPAPMECASCQHRQSGWFCSFGRTIQQDADLATTTISLPSQTSLFVQGDEARCLYIVCGGYLKLTARRGSGKRVVVRVAGPGHLLGLYAALSHGMYEVSAESLTAAQLRPVEKERFLRYIHAHSDAQLRAAQCICLEYRFALQSACRIALAETVAARLGRLLLDLGHQIGKRLDDGKVCFPLLLTHEEMASMAVTTRETVTRTLGQFRRDGWISIRNATVVLENPQALDALL